MSEPGYTLITPTFNTGLGGFLDPSLDAVQNSKLSAYLGGDIEVGYHPRKYMSFGGSAFVGHLTSVDGHVLYGIKPFTSWHLPFGEGSNSSVGLKLGIPIAGRNTDFDPFQQFAGGFNFEFFVNHQKEISEGFKWGMDQIGLGFTYLTTPKNSAGVQEQTLLLSLKIMAVSPFVGDF